MKKIFLILASIILSNSILAQFTFDYSTYGGRVALVSATASESPAQITINFLDYQNNPGDNFEVYRRQLHGTGTDWVLQANITAGTQNWIDTNVAVGDVWEYKVRRINGSSFAVGYIAAGLRYDQTGYRGRMILLVDNTFQTNLATEISQLKKDLTGDGWFVEELYVNRVTGWDGGSAVVSVKQQIQTVWNNAPINDKPTHLFVLGHVPVSRMGLGAIAPDDHDDNKGAHGSDSYYADLDGIFTDTQTYTQAENGGVALSDPNSENLPNDFRWDQDFIPSELEMAYSRVDFADLDYAMLGENELQLLQSYLTKLHNYKHVNTGWDMGENSAFNDGFFNSTDGAIRSTVTLSGKDNVYQYSGSDSFPQWVQDNGPFMTFWQNFQVPDFNEWTTYGMDAVLYSSDQSYWGLWDKANTFAVNPRALIARSNNKCLSVIWSTTGINMLHQTGIGETLGISAKRIIDHNSSNQIMEKPEQTWDDINWWNRTHMQLHGDPTLRFLQVTPASNLTANVVGSDYQINWSVSSESNLVGYHVYKSTSEFGIFTRLTSSPVIGTTYTDNTFSNSGEWYMVRAVKIQTSGSGTFLNPSQGIFIQSPATGVIDTIFITGFE